MKYGRSIAFEVTMFGWLRDILLDERIPERHRATRAIDLLRHHGYDTNRAPAAVPAGAPEGITP